MYQKISLLFNNDKQNDNMINQPFSYGAIKKINECENTLLKRESKPKVNHNFTV